MSQQSLAFVGLLSPSGSVPDVGGCPSLGLSRLFQATSDPQCVAVSFRLSWSPLFCPAGFLSAQAQGWFIGSPTAPRVPPPPASRGGLWCNQVGGIPGSPPAPQEVPFSLQGISWVCFPTPAPHAWVCPRLFPKMYSV